ncbi:MAG: ATP-binding protein [Myxococcota bacterium]
MLLRFGVENYRSIRDKQEISFARSALDGPDHVTREAHGAKRGILPVVALYGANASGKSNVLSALESMVRHVEQSHVGLTPSARMPTDPFRLDPAMRDAPTRFDVDIVIDGIHYHYGFAIRSIVEEEWLYAWPERHQQLWFHRVGTDRSAWRFGPGLTGQRVRIAELTRDNSLFLSAAAQNNHLKLLPIYHHFARGFSFVDAPEGPKLRSDSALFDEATLPRVLALLREADLGVLDAKVEDRTMILQEFIGEFHSRGEDRLAENLRKSLEEHGGPKELVLAHRGTAEPVWLPNVEESRGTLALMDHLHQILPALDHGSLVILDELDGSLHPDLARAVVGLFTDPSTNRRGAQLLFTTHDPSILDILRRDEVVVVDKSEFGATALTPISEFRVLKRDHLATAYAQGRYGGVPRLGWFGRALAKESESVEAPAERTPAGSR